MQRDIAIYGVGGFGREVACLIHMINDSLPEKRWNFIGFFDDGQPAGTQNEYGTVLGGLETLNEYKQVLDIAVAIGNPETVCKIVNRITNPNISFPNIIAPNTIFLDRNNVALGRGNIICSSCLLSCNVTIGDFNIFNGYIPVGHDTTIGNYNVFMPSVNISGGLFIGNCNFFGVQSVVLQYMRIGNNVRVGANSVIMRNTKDGNLYIGNPAIKVKL